MLILREPWWSGWLGAAGLGSLLLEALQVRLPSMS